MDTIQVLCRIGMSVTLIAVLLSIAAAQEAETPLTETTNIPTRDSGDEVRSSESASKQSATTSTQLHPFILNELPLLYDQLIETSPTDEQRKKFLDWFLPMTIFDSSVPEVDFTTHLIRRLTQQINIEIASANEKRLDWLPPLSEFLANLLSQLYADEKYNDAFTPLQQLEDRLWSIRDKVGEKGAKVLSDLKSMVAYYRLRCDQTILLVKHRRWGLDASGLVSTLIESHPGTPGAAAAAEFAGESLERQEIRNKAENRSLESAELLQPNYWYLQAVKNSPDSIFGKSAAGSLWRRDCAGKRLPISGGSPYGAQLYLDTDVPRERPLVVMLMRVPLGGSNGHVVEIAAELSDIANYFQDQKLDFAGVLCHSPILSQARLKPFPKDCAEFLLQAKFKFPCAIDFIDEDRSVSVRTGLLVPSYYLLDQDKKIVVTSSIPGEVAEAASRLKAQPVVSSTADNSPAFQEIAKEAAIPNISGRWSCPLIGVNDGAVSFDLGNKRTCRIRRSDSRPGEFTIDDYVPLAHPDEFAPVTLRWDSRTQQFEGQIVWKKEPTQFVFYFLKTNLNQSQMTIKWVSQTVRADGTELEKKELAEAIWIRQNEATSSDVEYHRRQTVRPSNQLVAEGAVRTKLDTTEVAKLRNEIEVYERRAKELASSIARLHLKVKDEPFEIDLLTKDLKSAVSNAYLKKSQLEQLRIQEMQKRVNQLQDQHRRRSARQTEIISQQVRELVSHARESWETENSDRSLDLGETDASEVSRSVQQFEENRFDRAIEVELPDSKRNSTKRGSVEVDRSEAGMEDARSKPIDTDAQFKSESSRSYNSLLTSLVSGQDEIREAEANFNRSMKLYEQKIEPFDFVSNAKRKLDTANMKQQLLTEEYQAMMRDLRLQLAAARFKCEESKEVVVFNEEAFAKKTISKLDLSQAQNKSRQDELAYQRLEVQLELFQKLNAFLQPNSSFKPFKAPLIGQKEIDCWGMRLESVRNEELKEALKQTKYRGGMRIHKVDPDSPAGKASIVAGDFLVGLGDWETTTADHVVWIQRHLHEELLRSGVPEIKFYIVRGGEMKFGKLEVPSGPIQR